MAINFKALDRAFDEALEIADRDIPISGETAMHMLNSGKAEVTHQWEEGNYTMRLFYEAKTYVWKTKTELFENIKKKLVN